MNKHDKPSTRAILALTWGLFIFGYLFFLAHVRHGNLGAVLFNADTLVIEAIYRDIFTDGYDLFGWRISNDVYLFPDFLFYVPLRALTGSVTLAIFALGFVQLTLVALLWIMICTNVVKDRFVVVNGLVLLFGFFFSLFMIFELIAPAYYIPHVALAHTGACINALVALYCTVRFINERKLRHLAALGMISFIAIISYKIYLIIAIVPMVLALLLNFGRLEKRLLLKICAVLIAALFSGRVAYRHLERLKLVRVRDVMKMVADKTSELLGGDSSFFAKLSDMASAIFRDFAERLHPAFFVVFCVWFLATLVFFIRGFRAKRGSSAPGPDDAARDGSRDGPFGERVHRESFDFLVAYFIVLVPALTLASALTGRALYGGFFQSHYLTMVFFLPFFASALYLAPALPLRADFRNAPGLLLLAALFLAQASLLSAWGPSRIFDRRNFAYEHELTRCLDANAEKHRLRYALSDFWNAKPITVFSEKGIRVNQIHYNLYIDYWMNNYNWYLGKTSLPEYDFVVTDRLNRQALLARYGPPAQILHCGKSEAFIYNRPRDAAFRRQFSREGLLLWKIGTGND